MADVITRLKLESGEYDSKIKRATQGLLQMEQECRKAGKSMNDMEADNRQFVQSLGSMQTVSTSVRGKIGELSSAFIELRTQYNRLTDEEKKGDYGKALSSSLSQLKTRINESKQQLADVSKELGETGVNMGKLGAEGLDLKSAMSTLGGQLGINTSLITGLSAGTMGAVAAIGALIAAEVKAAQAFAEYNEEIGKQSQVTTVTTGLSGGDAERMTTAARSLAKVYGTDFREVINAANTLMTQFGKSGDEAIELIRDGMQGMIMGDGGKLLSMIQQYAPSFRDAGIEASQLVAIIQNSEGGIFTDQNMNAIVMGIKNIRLMTNQTSEALAKMGIDGAEMTRKLNDGSMTIFEALGQVSDAIERTGSGSQAAGEVMQYVFGRQGAVAGTKLGEAIATLNTNLEETKRQTGGVGQATAELEQATERLDKAIRNCFGYDGWLVMSNGIKTDLTNAMADFLDVLNKVDHVMVSISGKGVFENMIDTIIKALGPLGTLAVKLNDIFNLTDKLGSRFGDEGTSTPSTSKLPNLSNAGAWGTTLNRLAPQTSTMADRPESVPTSAAPIKPIKPNTNKTPRIETSETATKELTIQQQISALEKEALTASEQRREEIGNTIRELDRELARQKEIVAALHKVPADAVDKAPTALQAAQSEAAKYIKAEETKVDTSTLQSILRNSLQEGIDTATLNLDSVAEQIAQGIDVPDETWQGILDEYNALREAIGQDPININFKTGNIQDSQKLEKDGDSFAESWNKASKAIGSIGSALQSIEDPTAKVAGLVAQAVAQIAATFAASLKGTFTPWDWIAGAAAGTATMISTISAIKSATKGGFAEGGIVPGNSFSGDNLRMPVAGGGVIGVNSGELILSKSQQDNIASALEQSDENALGGTPYVLGETIYIGLTNYLRRTGRGELITANR